ncbi:hypothetical protein QTP70_024759, partial [Hemibagrus guttatus]
MSPPLASGIKQCQGLKAWSSQQVSGNHSHEHTWLLCQNIHKRASGEFLYAVVKEGQHVNHQQDHGHPRVIDVHGEGIK